MRIVGVRCRSRELRRRVMLVPPTLMEFRASDRELAWSPTGIANTSSPPCATCMQRRAMLAPVRHSKPSSSAGVPVPEHRPPLALSLGRGRGVPRVPARGPTHPVDDQLNRVAQRSVAPRPAPQGPVPQRRRAQDSFLPCNEPSQVEASPPRGSGFSPTSPSCSKTGCPREASYTEILTLPVTGSARATTGFAR